MANPVKVNVAFVRARWGSARTDVPNLARWPLSVIEEVFQTRNGWSLGSYWDECSLGLRSLQFTFFDLGILKGDQHQKRDETIAAARKQCIDRNIPIAQYEHVVFLVDPANNDAGALGQGQDALFDQDASHEFFAHELGHVLGLDHPFGFIDGKPTEYADYYCLMGWTGPYSAFLPSPSSSNITSFFPGPPKREGDPNYFWSSGRMPSVATLYNHWKDFRERKDYVREASGAPDEAYELTAVSEFQEGGPVLLRIPGASGETFFVEYRLDSKWDKGLPYSVVVIHSFGSHDRDVLPLDWGTDRVWFEYEIPEPFFDTWASSPALGVEVVRQSHDKKKITIRVTRPSKRRKVELLDLPINRFLIDKADVDLAILSLNKGNDLLLCDSELKDYKVIIQTFGEQIFLELYLSGFIDPVAEWRINDILLTTRSGSVTPKVYAKKTVIRREGGSAELGWETRHTDATIKYEASLKGIYLWTMPQVGSYQLKIECKVRDRTLSSREPNSTRLATKEISVQGDSQLWDENYRRDVELCWAKLFEKPQLPVPDWSPRRPDPPPAWVDLLDKHAISKLIKRINIVEPNRRQGR